MKFYKSPNGEVFAYDSEDDRNEYGNPGLVKMTDEEVHAHMNPPEVKYIPEQVTRAQGKAALIKDGLWSGVLDYVESITDQTEKALAEVALNDTTHWQRSSPFLNSAAKSLGLSDEQLDDLFIQAEQIHL